MAPAGGALEGEAMASGSMADALRLMRQKGYKKVRAHTHAHTHTHTHMHTHTYTQADALRHAGLSAGTRMGQDYTKGQDYTNGPALSAGTRNMLMLTCVCTVPDADACV